MALDEHRQPDLMQHGHEPGVGLADPQGAAGTIEPEVMGQQHADRLGVQVPTYSRLTTTWRGVGWSKQGMQVPAQQLRWTRRLELGQQGRDHQDVLDDLVLDASLGILVAGSLGRERLGRLRIIVRKTVPTEPSRLSQPATISSTLPVSARGGPTADGGHDRADLDAVAVVDRPPCCGALGR